MTIVADGFHSGARRPRAPPLADRGRRDPFDVSVEPEWTALVAAARA
jgi:hypothetical protein